MADDQKAADAAVAAEAAKKEEDARKAAEAAHGGPSEYEKQLRRENAEYRKKADAAESALQAKLKAEEDAKNAALTEQGKFKDLYEQAQSKLKEFEPSLAELEQYRAAIKAEREALLLKLPEEKRPIYADAKIELLRDVLTEQDNKKPTGLNKPGPGSPGKKYEDYSVEELIALKRDAPDVYNREYRDWYKRKNGKEPPFTI